MGFFNNMKNAAVKKMMTAQMKKQGADDAQIKLVNEMLDENPQLFEKIGKEIEAETKAGKSQIEAAQSVMMKYQADLQKLMAKNPAMMQRMRLEAMKAARQSRK